MVAPLAISLAYAGVTWGSWRGLRNAGGGAAGARGDNMTSGLMALAVILHAALLSHQVFGGDGLRFGFAFFLSATMLVACALLWIEGFFAALGGLRLLLAPLAAASALLPAFFHGVELAGEGGALAMRAHIALSVLASSLFTLAFLLAVLMFFVDRHLHRPPARGSRGLAQLLEHMPSLLALESMLFRQIAAGFLLLTATLASGVAFSEELFGRPLRFDHKTVFAIISWVVMGSLLAGRRAFGWRGRVAQRWVFAGVAALLLAYVGSRFVFEVVLGRAWI